MSWRNELEVAVDVARGAARIVRDHFGRVERLTKTHAAAHDEAVTAADRDAQRFIVAGLRRRFPTDGVIGEESDSGTSITFECPDPLGRVWVIDPIDGTNNFIAGLEHFAVCIGLLEKGMPVLGVVLDVCRDRCYRAAAGEGAFLNDSPIHAPDTPLDDSSILMFTSNLLDSAGRLPAYAARFMGQTRWKVRILGSAALEAVAVAQGLAHGAVTVNGKLWDCVGAAAIVLEAGGCITDLRGNAVFPFDLRDYHGAKVPFLSAGPAARDELLAALRE